MVRFLNGYSPPAVTGLRFNIVQSVYHRFYTPLTNLLFIPCGGVYKARREVLDKLETNDGSRILETGIGSGDNIPFLAGYLRNCVYFGIDIQLKMLDRCRRKLARQNIPSALFLAEASRLPFRSESFDVVFHLGAMNLFHDKEIAILEMARVAKRGSLVVIADESEKAGKFLSRISGREPLSSPPIDKLPAGMRDVRLESIWNGFGYLLSFRAPLSWKP
jgi:ubiquinone/menaquinone biosynthesis C-methylase UbiE